MSRAPTYAASSTGTATDRDDTPGISDIPFEPPFGAKRRRRPTVRQRSLGDRCLASPPATSDDERASKRRATSIDRPDFPGTRRSSYWDTPLSIVKTKYFLEKGFESHMSDSLCEACEALDLDVDSFVVDNRAHAHRTTTNKPSFWGKKFMGTLGSIKTSPRDRCPLCRLLVKSLDDQTQSNDPLACEDDEAECMVYWTVDGRERVQDDNANRTRLVKRTRRLCIEWRDRCYDKAYVVLVAPQGRFMAQGSENDAGEWQGPTLFLGRLITSIEDSSIDLVKKWLRICETSHGRACSVEQGYKEVFVSEVQNAPISTMVDVEKMCLTDIHDKPDLRYVALSHSWQSAYTKGPYRESRVTLENHASFEPEGSLSKILDKMPKITRDSIALTKALGIRYLWADSLCIVQDDSGSWEINGEIIDVLYANAELTICAVDGDDAGEGFEGILDQHSGRDARLEKEFVAEYKASGKTPIQLLLSRPLETYLARSNWDARAWTLQERLLSRRNLFYVEGRLFFECHSTTFSDDIFSEEPIAGSSCGFQGSMAHILQQLPEDPISVYKRLLNMYATRSIGDESEILSAFSGVANKIGSSLTDSSEFLYGLPNSHFDWALLWQPESLPTRRMINGKPFPSWSWCGWRGAGIIYHPAMVSGPETHLHEWLSERTWITFYIRDGQGYLRLVWDPLRHKSKTNLDARLRGYDSPRNGLPDKTITIPKYDLHGRPFDGDIPLNGRVPGIRPHFARRLGPMRRTTTLPPGQKIKSDTPRNRQVLAPRPDTPYLQFWTWKAKLYLVEGDNHEPSGRGNRAGNGLRRFAMLDARGDFAGTCLLDESYTEAAKKHEPQDFIALSEAKDFHESEHGRWNLYTEQEDDGVPWQLYNVMMLYYDDKTPGAAYRAGIGKVYKWAFEDAPANADPVDGTGWSEIILG